jgi:sec-independent protein translocase protein TatB
MFDFSWGELVVIGAVALIVIGPKELPTVLRTLGQWMTKIRRMASEFQGQFQEAMREAEMADLKREIDTATRGFGSHFDDPFDETNRPKPDSPKPDSSTATAPDSTVSATLPAEPVPPTSEVATPDGYSVPAASATPPVTEADWPAVPSSATAEPASPAAASRPAVARPARPAASAATVAVPVAPAPAPPSPAPPAEHAAPAASPAPLVTEGSDRA